MTTASSCGELSLVLNLVNTALAANEVGQCCQSILPQVLVLANTGGGFVLVSDPRLPTEHFVSHGLSSGDLEYIETAHLDWLDHLADASVTEPMVAHMGDVALSLFPLCADGRVLGMVALAAMDWKSSGIDWLQLMSSIGLVFDRLAAKASLERKLTHFNTFLEVSSLLAKPVGLSESLEIALFSSMNAVSAEAASILLLDETKQAFRFFHVEGAAKPLLGETTFKATEGVAGRVLQTLEAEIVNDVMDDVQFYGQIDAKTGFRTRNLIAVPLLAGSEPIGVLEVLNRSAEEAFTTDDRLILISVADQIAYAIRNAAIFDRIVGAYCKRRQGADSCNDCPQPLESWAPCKEYRERLT
ncbi:GAF domain-containing protein [Candidatus Bipolaricaulota bacterium]